MPRRKLTQKEIEAIQKGKGRRVDPKTIERRLAKARQALAAAKNPLQKIELTEKVLRLEKALKEAQKGGGKTSDVEKAFIQHAASFARRKGISYRAFREMGVPPDVLAKAGIKRTRG